jgi:hypothetical protein
MIELKSPSAAQTKCLNAAINKKQSTETRRML